MRLIVIIAASFLGIANIMSQMTGPEILEKMDETVFAIEDKTVSMRMVMTNLKSGKEKVKEAILYQKGLEMKLFRYTAPESDEGISTLSLPNEEIYVYLPMFKKPKKITNLAESGIFTSSDFSIDNMANQTYSQRYVGELQDSNDDVYVVNMIPNAEKPNWTRVVAHIDKTDFYPLQLDFYNKKDEIEKQAKYQYTNVDGFWVAEQISMEDLKKNHKTTLFMSNIQINSGLSDDLFALENLAPEE